VGSPKAGVTTQKSRRLCPMRERSDQTINTLLPPSKTHSLPLDTYGFAEMGKKIVLRIRKSSSSSRRKRPTWRRRTGKTKFASFSANKGPFTGTQFKQRKLRPKTWRRSLLVSTRHNNHWRSNSATHNTITTATTLGQGTITVLIPFVPAAASPFWIVAGGAVPTDTSVAVPIFDGDITLRGGKIGLSLVKDVASTDVIQVQVWVFRLIANPELSLFPAQSPLGWDPSLSADVARSFGKVIGYRTVNMTTTAEDFNMEFRLGPQKIDQHVTGVNIGSQPCFIVKATNLTSNTAVNLESVMYHNMSFSGDAIGTT